MKKIGRKGQTKAVDITGEVLLAVLFVGVALAVVVGIGRSSVGAISAAQCKTSIELVNGIEQDIDKELQKLEDNPGCRWAFGDDSCVLPWNWESGAAGYVRDQAAQESADLAKRALRDLCLENIDSACPQIIGKRRTAADTAECIYRHSVTTYYTLQGGREDPKLTTKDGSPFNLYKIKVSFDDPSSVVVSGTCSEYVSHPAYIKKDCDKEKWDYACAQETTHPVLTGPACNISFTEVNEQTMALTMISKCQEKGPDDPACKCFVKPDIGYATTNGLPNTDAYVSTAFKQFESIDGAKYISLDPQKNAEYGKYRGCGYRTDTFSYNNQFGEYATSLEGAVIVANSILTNSFSIKPGDEQICYTRLVRDSNGKTAVSIGGEKQNSACEIISEGKSGGGGGGGTISYTLSITKSGPGKITTSDGKIDCGSDCVESYTGVTRVTLTATPDSGATFDGWNFITCFGSTAPCTITLDDNKQITALFRPPSGGQTCEGGGFGKCISGPVVCDKPLPYKCDTGVCCPKS